MKQVGAHLYLGEQHWCRKLEATLWEEGRLVIIAPELISFSSMLLNFFMNQRSVKRFPLGINNVNA